MKQQIRRRMQMLKMVLIDRTQRTRQVHRKQRVQIEVRGVDLEEVAIEHVVSMVLHRRKIEKIELPLQQQLLLINKITINTKSITPTTVCSDRLLHRHLYPLL